jgi:UDP-N-acetylmuramate--alanine ligase
LTEIYPARELPIPGVSSEIIFNQCHVAEKKIIQKEQITDIAEKHQFDVLLTMGAGDIELYREPLKKIIQSRK